jgi:excisionase family DNA binding protein
MDSNEARQLLARPTISVPEAGLLMGVCRNVAYGAVRSGELPVVRIGRSLRVPTALLRKLLGVEPSQVA